MIRSLVLPHIHKPVSILGLGAGTAVFTPETYDRAAELLDAYLDAGGNCIDTAHIYAFGASEKTLGRWLRERDTRAQVVLVDKGCHPVVNPQNLFGKPWEPRVTPEAIRADLSESLERLQTDTIDLQQIALAYVLQQPFPVIALVGPTTVAHLHALLEATN